MLAIGYRLSDASFVELFCSLFKFLLSVEICVVITNKIH